LGTGTGVFKGAGAEVALGARVAVATGTVAVGAAVLVGGLVAVFTGVVGITAATVGMTILVERAGGVAVFVRLQANKARAKTSINGMNDLRDMRFPFC